MEVDQDNTQQTTQFDYDMFVIGGGSGGISAARHAVKYGKKVALADFVKPSPAGSKWGIGGTCVNVGCIPKKMMHYSALLAEARDDLNAQGWDIDKKQTFQWEKLVKAVQQHIKSLNWGYKADLMKLKVKYFNSYATFIDEHTIQLDNGKGKIEKFTAKDIVLATGGRPSYPEIPGAQEFGITSDDLFTLPKAPGKTLVVGASYVALECAGFLSAFGYDTQVMVRSIFLRGFDQQMADRIANHMSEYHTKFIRNATPSKLEKADPNGRIKVTYSQDGEEKTEEYDTVLFAMGRYAVTAGLNMGNAGLTCEKNGKFKVDDREMIDAKVPHIYAIGDIQYGKLELTPTAIMAGMLLSKRLYGGSQ
jgi:thioredoxin reductase (NADPH)